MKKNVFASVAGTMVTVLFLVGCEGRSNPMAPVATTGAMPLSISVREAKATPTKERVLDQTNAPVMYAEEAVGTASNAASKDNSGALGRNSSENQPELLPNGDPVDFNRNKGTEHINVLLKKQGADYANTVSMIKESGAYKLKVYIGPEVGNYEKISGSRKIMAMLAAQGFRISQRDEDADSALTLGWWNEKDFVPGSYPWHNNVQGASKAGRGRYTYENQFSIEKYIDMVWEETSLHQDLEMQRRVEDGVVTYTFRYSGTKPYDLGVYISDGVTRQTEPHSDYIVRTEALGPFTIKTNKGIFTEKANPYFRVALIPGESTQVEMKTESKVPMGDWAKEYSLSLNEHQEPGKS